MSNSVQQTAETASVLGPEAGLRLIAEESGVDLSPR